MLIVISISAWKLLRTRWFALLCVLLTVGAFFFVRYQVKSTHVVEFIRSQSASNYTSFIENNYVDPKDASLIFPERKRNLIHIYLESVETTFMSDSVGGGFKISVIPELEALALQGESFSGSKEMLNGAFSASGATWTMGAAFASETGLPLKIPIGTNAMSSQNHFFKNVTALGDILKKAGYQTMVLKDVNMTFAGAEKFYWEHGNHTVVDYKYAVRHNLIPKDYFVWTGFEDKRLFEIAKNKLTELSNNSAPFAFTLFTNDTHFPSGYLCEACTNDFPDQYSNVFHCSSRQVVDFVRWIQKQPFYSNTTIVLHGDHPTMSSSYAKNVRNYERRVYTAIVNAPCTPQTSRKRLYTTYDIFPTILSAIGVKIPDHRLGLGVDLYQDTPTLAEKLGLSTFNHELSQGSAFMEKLGEIDTITGKTDLTQFCIRDFDCFLQSLKSSLNEDTLILLSVQEEGTKALTASDINGLQSLGLKASLLGGSRKSYIAAIAKNVLIEEVSNTDAIEKSFDFKGHFVQLRSSGFGYGQTNLSIDYVECSKAKRGMNIIVYDLKTQRVIATEAFDTSLSSKRRYQ